MSIFARGLVAAMEDETNAAELGIDQTGADSAEADMVQASDISADVEAGSAEIEQATADADTLGRIADTAEAAEADGGLDPVAAEVAEIAVEAIYARLGIKRSSYPALESFSGRSGRVRATRYAVEDIKETIKKIWAAVVNAFHKIVDFVKSLYNRLFDGNRKMATRLANISKKLRESTGDTTGKVKASGITNVVCKSDKGDIIKTIEGTVKELVDLTEFTMKNIEGLQTLASSIKINQNAGKEAGFLEKSKAAIDVYATMKKTAVFPGPILGPRITTEFADKSIGDSVKDAWKAVCDFGITIKNNIPFTDKPEIDVLSKSEIEKIGGAVSELIDFNLAKKVLVTSFETTVKKSVMEAEQMAKMAPDGDGQAAFVEDMRIAARAINVSGATSVKVITFGGQFGTQVAKAGLDYIERSIATIKAN